MTNLPPSNQRSSRRTALGLDELIGILVAFATIGAILFWSFSRRDSGLDWTRLLSSFSSSPSTPAATPNLGLDGNLNLQPPTNKIEIPKVAAPQLPSFTLPDPTATLKPQVIQPKTQAEEQNAIASPSILGVVPPLNPPPLVQPTPPTVQIPQALQKTLPPSTATIKEKVPLVPPVAKKPTIPTPITFADVPANSWKRPFIDTLSSRGIIKGFPDNTFKPDQPVTRAEFAAILQEAFDKEIGQGNLTFTDVEPKYWATPAIDQAIKTGFLKGYPDKTFKPDQRIPRVQVLVALASGLGLKPVNNPEKIVSVYQDSNQIPKYAIEKVATATTNGLVVNEDPKVFNPNQEATRAEVAAMVHQALVKMGRLEPVKSNNIVQPPR